MTNSTSPKVSVVVPCRNEKDNIGICIRSVLGQDPPDGDFEVIVADGMSEDGTGEILRSIAGEDPRLRIIENPGRIVSTGLNAAIQAARGSIILRMDAHTRCAPNYIRRCLEVLDETGADNVGGPWIATGSGFVGKAIAAAFQSAFATGGARGHDPSYTGPVDTVYLGCWPRTVFSRIGVFDEELVRNQDDEFNLRLARAGGKIWQSASINSTYCPRESLTSLFLQQVQYGYWKVRVIQKHKIPASFRHLVPGSFLLVLSSFAFAAPWSRIALLGVAMIAGLYFLFNILGSTLVAARTTWRLFPLLPLVFACYHLGYGYGFLRGLLDFVILSRSPGLGFTKLTRTSETTQSFRSFRW